MAQRRMFNKSITNSSKFLKMPMSSRLLYYDLGMNADDDGFVEHFMVLRMTGATEQDLGVLEINGLVKVFDENVLWIKDWKENNYIRNDRYVPSKYLSVYSLETLGIPMVSTGKDSIGKYSIGNKEESEKKPIENRKETEKKTNNNFLFLISNYLYLKDKKLLREKIEEWLEYKKQRKDKQYTEIGFKKLLKQIENNTNTYGEQAIVNLIDECMGNNYQGIIFDKLKKNNKTLQNNVATPEWFNKDIEHKKMSEEDLKELDNLISSMV